MPSIPGIPPEARSLFDRLHDGELAPATTLRDELSAYAELARESTPDNDMLDNRLIDQLVHACEALIEIAEAEDAEEPARRLVQAAVGYVVADEDGEPDRDSLWGLDDDVAVLNAVVRHLDRGDLVVKVP